MTGEKLLTLEQARLWLEEAKGLTRSQMTLWSWATRGRGGVKLEVIDVAGTLHTSREALGRFFGNTTAARAADAGIRLEVLKV